MNYYNENNPRTAAWLRELIKQRLIPMGEVDERSIVTVQPGDLSGFTQCHFFAGIGGWSEALRIAGWPESRPVWTGSCPCQPFSCVGKQLGENDERHLWPEFLRLIGKCAPTVCFGEQVASPAGRDWLAGIRTDLEALDFAVGAADLCVAGIGAPHMRQRLFWLAQGGVWREVVFSGECDEDGDCPRCGIDFADCGCPGPTQDGYEYSERNGAMLARWVGNGIGAGLEGQRRDGDQRNESGRIEADASGSVTTAGRAGYWDAHDLLAFKDGKRRRVEPGTFPMAYGFPARVDLLRGYGNAINPYIAAEFIKAYLEINTWPPLTK